MGESVKINELINKMINLSGFTVRDEKNPDGDIEIKIIGLRPGENRRIVNWNNPEKTNHPKIQKTNDPFIPFDQLEYELKELKIF